MIQLPEISNYGQYSSGNYGVHTKVVTIRGLTVYFSYNTPVAFIGGNGLIIRENDWSTTTGRHLNWIDPDKNKRIPGDKFEELLSKECGCSK